MTPESENPSPPPEKHHRMLDEAFRGFKEKEDGIREEIRRELALREQRLRMSELREEEDAKQRLEARLRSRLVREEEEKYFAERGYVQYVNRYGQVEWVPAEEAARRKQMRRKEFIRNLFSASGRKRLRKYGIGAALTVALLVVVYILARGVSRAPGLSGFGSVIVQTDIPNAQIYIDGDLKDGVTPRQINNIPEGVRTFVVVKEGYVSKPPVKAVQVSVKKLQTVSFELTSIPYLGKVMVEVKDLQGEFQLLVDGFVCPMDVNRQVMVPIGFHVFTVVKSGYLADPPYVRTHVTRDDITHLEFRLTPEKDLGALEISGGAPYGYIYIDGKFTGMRANDACITMRAGTYEISVRQNGYRADPLKQVVDVQPNGRNRLVFSLKPVAEETTVAVQTTTPGANIFLDGEFLPYVTPMPDLALSPGEHFLNLYRDGKWYQPEDLTIIGTTENTDQRLDYDF